MGEGLTTPALPLTADEIARVPFIDVAIVGAGVSGLALARGLEVARALAPSITYQVWEAGQRPGGVIETRRPKPGYVLDYGANSLFVDDRLLGFLRCAGLGPDYIEGSPASRARYVVREGRLRRLPGDPLSLLISPFFSLETKRWLFRSRQMPPRPPDPAETVEAFFLRHFGPEVTRYALEPFVSGIYAGHAGRLLMAHTFANLQALEARFGSVIKGLRATQGQRPPRRSISFVEGMGTLPEALADMITPVAYRQPLEALYPLPSEKSMEDSGAPVDLNKSGGYLLKARAGAGIPWLRCRRVVLAGPAWETARVLAPLDPGAAWDIDRVRYAPVAQVHLAYDRAAVRATLKGFGALHAPTEGRASLGAIWVSSVYPMRCPPGQALFCVFVGGDHRPETAHWTEGQFIDAARADTEAIYGIKAAPRLIDLTHWPRGIPQYDQHQSPLQAHLDRLAGAGLHLIGNWSGGVSLADSLRRGDDLAYSLAGGLSGMPA